MTKSDFYVIFVEDHDTKEFGISGPVLWRFVDDWLFKISEQQRLGRAINGQDIAAVRRGDAVSHAQNKGYAEVDINKLISTPRDRSHDYKGSLPKYAQTADRAKVVKILCKVKCRTARWAELNKPYPGKDALHSAEMGEYKATCLKCGSVAPDNYNWYR